MSTNALYIAVSTSSTMRCRNRYAEGFNGDSVGLAAISVETLLGLERKESERHIDLHELAVTPVEEAERNGLQRFAGHVQGLRS